MSLTTIPGPGHNSGITISLHDLLDPSMLSDQWEMTYQARIKRRDELLAGVARMKETFANGITTEEEAEEVTDFANQIRDEAKLADPIHEREKAPYLAACRAADAFFLHDLKGRLREQLPYFIGDGRGEPLGLLTRYQREKVERERLQREEQAKKAREEADRAAAAAERTMSPDVIDTALQLDQQAQAASAMAAAPTVDLSRTRGSRGGVSSLRDNWVWELIDFKALLQAVIDDKVPINYVVPNETLLNSLVKGKNGLRDIPGLKITNQPKTGL